NILAFLIAKLRGKPVVLTQHISMVPYKSVCLRLTMRTAYAIFGRLLLGYSDQVVFYSKEVYSDFRKRYRINSGPTFIANGVDIARFAPAAPDERSRLRQELFALSDESPVFLFVGRFVEKKGLPVIRQLARALPDIPFVMLGEGPLQPESWSLTNVQVHRGLDNAAVAQYYKAADLMILPSIGEGLPLVMQEAMSTGLPVIVSSRTANADPVATQCVFHEPCLDELDEDEVVARWTRRLRELADDPVARNAHVEQLRETVLQHWTWEVCAGRYAEVMDSLLRGDPN
ncbi:MAG: glycosyltransferase family 4 protein, partial [Candidatus Hydrogenedentes bacterium]|nr:glycosyltransferase family 4 protein [Candidatus Hydrogenedentota bacterium]